MSTFTTLDAKPDHVYLTLRRVRDDKARRLADYLCGDRDGHLDHTVQAELMVEYQIARDDFIAYDRAKAEAHLAATGGGPDGA